jgi:hypothetical protein
MSILYPVFALVALTAITLFRLAFARVRAIREGRASLRYFATYQDGREPDETRVLARHYDNLFQAPLLFYVAARVILITHRETAVTVGLAWAYVALRVVHTAIHTTTNDVPWRFRVFAASWLVLVLLWGVLAFATLS